jgi:hypothetical protein
MTFELRPYQVDVAAEIAPTKFGNPTLVGLQVKLDCPVDRERPCCLNICTISPARGPHAGELVCAGCGQHRGWLSKSAAQWIEHVVTRFGAPTTPIVMRKSRPYEEEPDTAPPTPVSEAERQQRIELIRRHVAAERFTAKDLFLTQDDRGVRRPPPPEEAKARARWKTQERRRRPIARRMALWGITAHDLDATRNVYVFHKPISPPARDAELGNSTSAAARGNDDKSTHNRGHQ